VSDREKIKTDAKNAFIQGVSLAQIAKDTGVPAGTIRRWKMEGNWDDDIAAACKRSIKKTDRSKKKVNVRIEKVNVRSSRIREIRGRSRLTMMLI
jgi:uncharacterized protein YjcR